MNTILIVEDERVILNTLRDFLESEGYSTLTASNGKMALDILSKSGMPHLIILDMKMPVMDGWEFAEKLSEQYMNRAPIIVATAAVDAQQRAKDVNAVDWVEKPFILDELLEKIQKHISA